MRIITGTARGKRLNTVPGNDVVRPTPERVKEALFSAIQFDLEGRRILDLFAGSGQLGIEALSRGAESATFVDSSNVSLDVVRQNLDSAGFTGQAKVIRSDYAAFCATCNDTFDIAFLDPPYQAGFLEKALSSVCRLMSEYGIIICEHPSGLTLPQEVNGFAIKRTYRYGKVLLSLYKKGGADN